VCCYNSCHGNAVMEFGPYGIVMMFTTLDFPVILDGQFTRFLYIDVNSSWRLYAIKFLRRINYN
jgi:hypothetical protein